MAPLGVWLLDVRGYPRQWRCRWTVAVKVARPVAAATGVGKEYETARAQVKVAAEAAKSLTKSLRGTST
jgi:hypothetical protein